MLSITNEQTKALGVRVTLGVARHEQRSEQKNKKQIPGNGPAPYGPGLGAR